MWFTPNYLIWPYVFYFYPRRVSDVQTFFSRDGSRRWYLRRFWQLVRPSRRRWRWWRWWFCFDRLFPIRSPEFYFGQLSWSCLLFSVSSLSVLLFCLSVFARCLSSVSRLWLCLPFRSVVGGLVILMFYVEGFSFVGKSNFERVILWLMRWKCIVGKCIVGKCIVGKCIVGKWSKITKFRLNAYKIGENWV